MHIKTKYNLNTLQILTLGMVFFLSSCAHLESARAEGARDKLKEILKMDWKIQKKKSEIQNQNWESCPETQKRLQSVCSRDHAPKFEIYDLEKSSIMSTENMVATALYCSSEKKYWVEQRGGDYAIECRTLGPFSLDEK